jgi:hypothetical protein
MAKASAALKGLHNLRGLQSAGIRSIPHSSTSAFLDLFALQGRRERLTQDKAGLRMRRDRIQKELATISKNISGLLKIALRSSAGTGKKSVPGEKKHVRSTVLEY